jgi:hypothetical protein
MPIEVWLTGIAATIMAQPTNSRAKAWRLMLAKCSMTIK